MRRYGGEEPRAKRRYPARNYFCDSCQKVFATLRLLDEHQCEGPRRAKDDQAEHESIVPEKSSVPLPRSQVKRADAGDDDEHSVSVDIGAIVTKAKSDTSQVANDPDDSLEAATVSQETPNESVERPSQERPPDLPPSLLCRLPWQAKRVDERHATIEFSTKHWEALNELFESQNLEVVLGNVYGVKVSISYTKTVVVTIVGDDPSSVSKAVEDLEFFHLCPPPHY